MTNTSKPRRSFAWRPLIAMQAGACLIVTTAAVEMPTRIVWNASASVPIGLYAVRPDDRYRPGVIVLAQPPEPLAAFLTDGGYLPRDVPLLKRIEAVAGQTVCRHGRAVTVDGERRAEARDRDRLGRPLPVWSGCREIADGELFLLNVDAPGSLDGRYFGPIPVSNVVGRAVPLLVREGRR